MDMKDRLLYGRDQRWAYVSTSMWYGKIPWLPQEITEAEAEFESTTTMITGNNGQLALLEKPLREKLGALATRTIHSATLARLQP